MVDDNVIDHMYADEEQREKDDLLRKKLGDKEFEMQIYGIVEKDESEEENAGCSANIKGTLIIGDKIWFNDDIRCRFRMCGFSREQIKMLKKAKFIDISIMEHIDDDTANVRIYISQFHNDSDCKK